MTEAFTGPTLTDLSTDAAQVQARHELNQILDQLVDNREGMRWVRKWGAAALDALDKSNDVDFFGHRVRSGVLLCERAMKALDAEADNKNIPEHVRDKLRELSDEFETIRDEIEDL